MLFILGTGYLYLGVLRCAYGARPAVRHSSLLMWMGQSTLHASNIKGFEHKFAHLSGHHTVCGFQLHLLLSYNGHAFAGLETPIKVASHKAKFSSILKFPRYSSLSVCFENWNWEPSMKSVWNLNLETRSKLTEMCNLFFNFSQAINCILPVIYLGNCLKNRGVMRAAVVLEESSHRSLWFVPKLYRCLLLNSKKQHQVKILWFRWIKHPD